MNVTDQVELIRRQYIEALLEGRRNDAVDLTLRAVEQGIPVQTVIDEIIAQGQVAVGDGWHAGKVTVSQEHRASTIAEYALQTVVDASMSSPLVTSRQTDLQVMIACAEGEWHTLPGKLACETFRLHGYECSLIGPSVPADDLAFFIGNDVPPVIVVTCTMPMSLLGAWKTISSLRALGTTVVAGGHGFGPAGQWSGSVGADAFASTFTEAVDIVSRYWDRQPTGPRVAAGDPSRIAAIKAADDRRPAIEAAAIESIVRAYPDHHNPDLLRKMANQDVEQLFNAIVSSLLVDDMSIVTDYLAWYLELLANRLLPTDIAGCEVDSLCQYLSEELTNVQPLCETAHQFLGQKN